MYVCTECAYVICSEYVEENISSRYCVAQGLRYLVELATIEGECCVCVYVCVCV